MATGAGYCEAPQGGDCTVTADCASGLTCTGTVCDFCVACAQTCCSPNPMSTPSCTGGSVCTMIISVGAH